jgi:hypothetical protein
MNHQVLHGEYLELVVRILGGFPTLNPLVLLRNERDVYLR